MKRVLFGVLLGLGWFALAPPALAATGSATINWQRPTTWTDGSALAASSITAYQVECTLTPTGGSAQTCSFTPTTLAGNVLTGTVTLTYPPEGARACFRLRAVALNAANQSVVGDPSADTSNSCKDFAPIRPSAPTNVTVTVTVSITVQPVN